jgi:hypothetical protein
VEDGFSGCGGGCTHYCVVVVLIVLNGIVVVILCFNGMVWSVEEGEERGVGV